MNASSFKGMRCMLSWFGAVLTVFSLCNGSLTAAGYSGNSRKTGCGAELFLKNPKKYFEGFSATQAAWQGLGKSLPNKIPAGAKMSRK